MVEVSHETVPFQLPDFLLKPVLQLLHEDQGEEAAKDMAPDGLVPFMENGTGVQHRLDRPERLFHHPELLVLERDLICFERGIDGEYPCAVIACLAGDLVPIDADGFFLHADIPALPLVPDEALRSFRQLLFEARQDGLPGTGILFGLFFIAADDVPLALVDDLFHLEGIVLFFGRDLVVSAGTAYDRVSDLFLVSHPHPEDVLDLLLLEPH